jgi:uncharacterized protein
MNPVVQFEMPAENRLRMADFYTTIFGWQIQLLGPDTGNYASVLTTETDMTGRPKTAGAINGGFFPKSKENPAKHPSIVIGVDNIKKYINKVKQAGGKVLGDPVRIPEVGLYASFIDTEGNLVSMLQPSHGI